MKIYSLYYKHCIDYRFFTLNGKFVLIFKNKIGCRSTVKVEYPLKRNKRVGNIVNKNGLQCIPSEKHLPVSILQELLTAVCHLLLQKQLLCLWFSYSVLLGSKVSHCLSKDRVFIFLPAFLALLTPEIQMDHRENNL